MIAQGTFLDRFCVKMPKDHEKTSETRSQTCLRPVKLLMRSFQTQHVKNALA